jgi:glycosyltransferase involved in cell wall biosynthesis
MKILFVVNTLGAGGAERSLTELLNACPADIDPTVVCFENGVEGVEADARDRRVDLRVIGDSPRRWVPLIRRIIRGVHPDVVHTTLFEADVAGRIAAVGTGVPVATSLVNTPYEPVRLEDANVSARKLQLIQVLDGLTARHLTTHFHAITGAVRDAAVRDLRLDPAHITVIERGRDPRRLGEPNPERRLQARRALGVDPDALTLVTLGRQEFQKGQWHLIEAMPKILAEHPDAVLLLAGREGNVSDRLRRAASDAGLEEAVRFLGHRDDAPEILAAGDVFVFPSLYEGLGGALIEAMALGLPIVASDLPAVREVVEPDRNALLVRAGSPQDLAGAVLTLASDLERRRRMGERGRAIFQERFTLERSARRMLELFERVASEGRHPRR